MRVSKGSVARVALAQPAPSEDRRCHLTIAGNNGDMQSNALLVLLIVLLAAGTRLAAEPLPVWDAEPVDLDGRTFVVSPDGDDSAKGDEANPLRTLQAAADRVGPGDTVLVRAGTYTNDGATIPLVIRNGGTTEQWVRFANFPGERPLIEFNSIRGIQVEGASHIVIEGFELDGRSDEVDPDAATKHGEAFEGKDHSQQQFFGVGIRIGTTEGPDPAYPHHVIVRDNIIHDTSGGGISTARADYLLIENNVVFRTSFYTPWGGSGISVWQNHNFDERDDVYRVVVRGNRCFDNDNKVKFWMMDSFSDGNGIILDALRNSQENIVGDGYTKPYSGRVLVTGNACWNNGGRGVNIYESDHIDVIDNVLIRNSTRSNSSGEIELGRTVDVRIVDNVIEAGEGKRAIGGYEFEDVTIEGNVVEGAVEE